MTMMMDDDIINDRRRREDGSGGTLRRYRHRRRFSPSTLCGSSFGRLSSSTSASSSSSSSSSSSIEDAIFGNGGEEEDADGENDDDPSSSLLDESIEYLAYLIKCRLASRVPDDDVAVAVSVTVAPATTTSVDDTRANVDRRALARGRFADLTTTVEGERMLEDIFRVDVDEWENYRKKNDDKNNDDDAIGEGGGRTSDSMPHAIPSKWTIAKNAATTTTREEGVVRLSIVALQSLLIYGMQIGVKGSDEMQLRAVRHLYRVDDDHRAFLPSSSSSSSSYYLRGWDDAWDAESVRRLKFRRDSSLGRMLLGKMKRKRTSRGAFDLLVELGAWDRHVDTSLLRSGFPVRFTDDEIRASMDAEKEGAGRDPDDLLGIRADLRHFKVYTIDGESTADIDDGISVEVLEGDGGVERGMNDGDGMRGGEGTTTTRHRYWIHIADVDRWAPRGSALLGVAERRGTSLYLPTMTLCMFPEK